jgi:hypothetical protein
MFHRKTGLGNLNTVTWNRKSFDVLRAVGAQKQETYGTNAKLTVAN